MPKLKKKICNNCAAERLETEFHFDDKKRGIRRNTCKFCRRKYLKSLTNRECDIVAEKECRTCKQTRLAAKFSRDSRSKDGLSYRCKSCHRTAQKKYRSSTKGQKTRKRLRKVYTWKYRSTPNGKIREAVSRSVRAVLAKNGGSKNGGSVFTALPYTPQELRTHLEEQFQDGMGWKNYGRTGWHIDHIVAHSNFHYTSLEDPEFLLCWNLINLRPMWAIDNLEKGSLSRKEYQERKNG